MCGIDLTLRRSIWHRRRQQTSLPAKAGDPAFQSLSDRIEKPQRTGYPLSAGMTASHGAARCTIQAHENSCDRDARHNVHKVRNLDDTRGTNGWESARDIRSRSRLSS